MKNILQHNNITLHNIHIKENHSHKLTILYQINRQTKHILWTMKFCQIGKQLMEQFYRICRKMNDRTWDIVKDWQNITMTTRCLDHSCNCSHSSVIVYHTMWYMYVCNILVYIIPLHNTCNAVQFGITSSIL